ncbi:Polyketide synthase [Tolypocladium capitatum]|uniref:Polyketide synthase n=1 Tax=Tolypocladium capitatum TaxID=45235 RepID=A0A2K3QQ41_9HYPO|nr:Polyketide synthase [Tolypocladium capitatum]
MDRMADKQDPLAIIGAACRLPGETSSVDSLWDMISHARTGHGKVPPERWNADIWHHPDPDRKGGISVRHGYFLNQNIGHFDAPFFSTTAKEAAAMDPMKRLLLEVSYESIENAGLLVEDLMNSKTGCYVGCMTNDYEMMSLRDIYDVGHTAASATSEAMTANRVSWFFGLKGPSLTLDTACSSSLYALHLACQSLRLGETNMSLVAGVNLILSPNTMHQLSAMHMLSPEGISHTFDDRANGYGRGEGIGCLVVKRLSDALRDGDTIRAVIRATGVNADGKTPSITQPSSRAQAELITSTYEAAGLDMNDTQYFECHGTGTPVGDPIELEALAATLGDRRTAAGLGPLYIGSIKPNVGHTEGCSGLAGILKAIACLEQGMLVPTYGVETLNPKLRLGDWNLKLPPQTMKWPSPGQRRISVNSFGFGGANAHAILDDSYHYLANRGLVGHHNTIVHDDEDASESGVSVGTATPLSDSELFAKRLFVFSSKDQSGLQRLAKAYVSTLTSSKLDDGEGRYLEDLAHTLSTRRSYFDFRGFCVASSLEGLTGQLSKGIAKTKRPSRQRSNLLFVFTGQGAQWPAMGVQLLNNPVFQESILKSQEYLEKLGCAWSVVDELKKTDDSQINHPEFSQTLCTVLQVAIVDLLKYWKVMPKATVGHSSGEIAAAYAASYITQADAVKIAYVRGLTSAAVTLKGAMLAAGISRDEARQYLAKVQPESAVVACINSPSSVTLSGDVGAIDELEKLISADNKFARKLKVKTAYHSPHMKTVAQGYLDKIGHVSITDKELAVSGSPFMYSSLTGQVVSPEQLSAEYWVSNMCAPVEFSSAVTGLLSHTSQPSGTKGKEVPTHWDGIVEIGPHAALKGPVQQIIAASANKTAKDAAYMSMILRGQDATESSLHVAGKLWAIGHGIDLSAVNGHECSSSLLGPKSLSNLPPYPWNHTRTFWHEAYSTRSHRFPAFPRTDLLGVPVDMQNSFEPRWKNHLRISENPWIEDHQITGTTLYPAAGMLVMALEGALQLSDATRKLHGFRFRDVGFERGLVVPSDEDGAVETRLSLLPDKGVPGQYQFTIFSTTTSTSWTKHCRGTVALEYSATSESEVEDSTIDTVWAEQTTAYEQLVKDTSAEQVDVDSFYDHLQTIGMEYGPLFRNVVSLLAVPLLKASHGAVLIPDTKSSMPEEFEYPHVMHPATMDAIFHLLLAAFNDGRPVDEAAVPYSITDMFVAAEQPQGVGNRFHGYGQLTAKSAGGHEIVGDLVVSDETWSAPKLTVKGFALRRVTSGKGPNSAAGWNRMKKCARVEWYEDIAFIKSGKDVSRLHDANGNGATSISSQLSLWLDRLLRKQVVGEVLVIADEESPATSDIVQEVLKRHGRQPGFGNVTTLATTPTMMDRICSKLPQSISQSAVKIWDIDDDSELPELSTKFDAIFLLSDRRLEEQPGPLLELQKVLSPVGHFVATSTPQSKMAETLRSLGFSLPITISNDGLESIVITSALPTNGQRSEIPEEVYLLVPFPTTGPSKLSTALAEHLNSLNIGVHERHLATIGQDDLLGKHIISLLEAESPLIYSWTKAEFDSFKTLVSKADHLLWITRGGLLKSWDAGAEFAPAQGLIRVLRNEYTLTTLPHLDLSSTFDLGSTTNAQLLVDVWLASQGKDAEMEFAEFEGMIHIPRVVDEPGFDAELQLASGTPKPVKSRLGAIEAALKLIASTDGQGCLGIVDESVSGALGPTDVEIDVEFVGLGVSETSTSSFSSKEAVGIVSRCGDQVTSVGVGHRVAVLHDEACRTKIRADATLVTTVPVRMSPKDAATLSVAFVTAQYTLLEVAGLRRGQVVLINSAASDLGQAAVQISQTVGAAIFGLVESKAEKDVLVAKYSVPSSHIFDSGLSNFVTAIGKLTDSRGVDVVFNPHLNKATAPSASVLGDFGCLLNLSSEPTASYLPTLPASRRNASIIRIDMSQVTAKKPDIIQTLFQRTFNDLYHRGAIRPISPATVFSVEDLPKAIEALKAPYPGKIVLSLEHDASVFAMPPPAPILALGKDATYVLAGGLGVLGLNIANIMVAHGAKHLVFLSRSGGSKNENDLECLRSRGCDAEAFQCDVTDAQSVTTVFQHLKSQRRVVKGVIQCAMVLEDTIFENMTHAKWSRAFLPKTRGSGNLLAQLWPSEDPFFILLSSITGVIGNTAQANYASGNTFEDALAHHARAHLGIRATSIDVGLVSDSSHFTAAGEFGNLDSYRHKYQHGWTGLQTNLEELQVALLAVMRGSTADGRSIPAQFVLGLGDKLVRNPGSTGFERDRKFDLRVVQPLGLATDVGAKEESVGEKLGKATSLTEAAAAVEESLKKQIAASIGVGVDEVDVQKPLPDFGVDSLNAVEIRNRALKEMQSNVSVFELLSATPMTDLAVKIASRSGLVRLGVNKDD